MFISPVILYCTYAQTCILVVRFSVTDVQVTYPSNTASHVPGAQSRLKSWGGPRFRSQHRGAKGRAGCWVREGVSPSRCEGPGVSPPENFWKLRC